jgi:hypothetical protein
MAIRPAVPMFDLPPGTDRHAYSYAASPVGLAVVAASAAASLLPWGTLVAWVLAVAGSVAVILATEQGLDDFPSPARLRELPGWPRAVARGLLGASWAAAPLLVLLVLAWLAARAPEEQVLERAVTLGAPVAFLAFLYTVHTYFPALLTATLDPAPFASLHRAHRKQVAGNLFLLHALAYAGLFVLFFVRTMVHFLPEALQGALTAAAFAYLHLAFSRLAASASRSHRRAFAEGAGG